METEITDHKDITLDPVEEYKLLKEILQKMKKDLLMWRLKLKMSERQRVRMNLTSDDLVPAERKGREQLSPADMLAMAVGKSKAEILICEETIYDITERMSEIYEHLDPKARKEIE